MNEHDRTLHNHAGALERYKAVRKRLAEARSLRAEECMKERKEAAAYSDLEYARTALFHSCARLLDQLETPEGSEDSAGYEFATLIDLLFAHRRAQSVAAHPGDHVEAVRDKREREGKASEERLFVFLADAYDALRERVGARDMLPRGGARP